VVCLPSAGVDRSAALAAFEPAFARVDPLRRIYVDLPGWGRSRGDSPTSDATVHQLVAFLEKQFSGEPVLLAGWSYGGYLACALARRRPDLVQGLLLVCPGVRANRSERRLPVDRRAKPRSGWLDDAPPELVAHLDQALGNRTPQVLARVLDVLRAVGPSDEAYLRELQERGYPLGDEDEPLEFGGPTAVVAGRHDLVVGYADQFELIEGLSHGSFSVIDEAGHYLPFEQPQLFRAAAQHRLAQFS
jgi:pimeloyl-ACP methyl ester carboxylesterase